MNTDRWYSPDGGAEQAANSANDAESTPRQEGAHEPGNTPLEDQEELPGGYIHGHAEQDEDEEKASNN